MVIFPSTLLGIFPVGCLLYMHGTLSAETFLAVIVLSFGVMQPLITAFSYTDDIVQVKAIVGEVAEVLSGEDISPKLFQVAVRLIAGEGRRHHKGRMAEQIVLHIRLIDDLVFGTAENLSDQFRIGDRPTQLPNGDFFRSIETTRSGSRCPAESAKANKTFFSCSAAASALACTLLPTKTIFFV